MLLENTTERGLTLAVVLALVPVVMVLFIV